MIVLSRRFGALADRIGSRVLISLGALVAGCGLLLLARVDRRADYLSEVLPALLVFGLGLAMLVAPLTATVLGAVAEGSRRRRGRGEYDALTGRAALRGRRAGSRRLSCVCWSRRRDATTIRARSRWPRCDQPRQATASRLAQPHWSAPGERVLLRATFEDASVRLPCCGHDRSRARRQRRSDCARRDPQSPPHGGRRAVSSWGALRSQPRTRPYSSGSTLRPGFRGPHGRNPITAGGPVSERPVRRTHETQGSLSPVESTAARAKTTTAATRRAPPGSRAAQEPPRRRSRGGASGRCRGRSALGWGRRAAQRCG